MNRSLIVICVLVATSWAGPAVQQREQKKGDERIAEELASTNTACGTKLTARMDWAAWGALDDEHHGGVAAVGPCTGVLEGIASFCGKDDQKKAVVAALKSVTCTLESKAVHESRLKNGVVHMGTGLRLDAGALRSEYNWESHANVAVETYGWLEKQL